MVTLSHAVRLEHLRGCALGVRNLTNYIARALLETGGFRPNYTVDREEPVAHRAGGLFRSAMS